MSLTLPAAALPEDGRFRALSRIGEGGMGVVYRVHDTRLGLTVAAKSLRHLGSEEIYRLKREFRTLAGLRHPNLVRLYELFVGEGHCFFTMEFVAGASFVEHTRGRLRGATRGAPPGDLDRLRDALVQLTEGLDFLHGHAKIHRDIKPTNVLVDRAGRVVILDFGLATGVLSRESQRSLAGSLAGTLAYMAPEQLAGDPLTRAADWYSVGVMLFETLTGELPFGESFREVFERAGKPAPSPRAVVGDVPEDLERVTRILLSPRPEDREAGPEMLRRLGAARARSARRREAESARPSPDVFVGREAQLASLREALAQSRERLTVVEIVGPSGMGKSALVERFAAELGPETAVFRSRCHPRETVPFKAMDGLIDGLTRLLGQQDEKDVAPLRPRSAAALLATFPVMGRVPALAGSDDDLRAIDPHERRRQAFSALRELLARLSDTRPLVLWIDDAQWGDADSAAALRTVCGSEDSPRALLVLCHRASDEGAGGDAASVLIDAIHELPLPVSRVPLGAMARDDLRALVEMWMRSADRPSRGHVEAIVDGAEGSPFLAIELARSLASRPEAGAGEAPTLGQLLLARVAGLPRSARRAVELLAVAGHPVDESTLAVALECPLDQLWDLADQRLLRLLPQHGETAVAIYHDALREAVVAAVKPEEKREIHRRLASALHRFPGRDDEYRIDHLLAAGDLAGAAEAAYEEAELAAQAASFHRAASLYLKAIELGTRSCPGWLLFSKLADCLVAAGRSAEAAVRFLEAAGRLEREAPADLEVLALRRRAASEFLRGGLYPEGYRVLTGNYQRMGMPFPSNRAGAFWRISLGRLGIGARRLLDRATGPRPRRQASPYENEKLELSWTAGQGSSFVDVLRAAAFQVQHAELSLRIGDARHLARAQATEAMFVAFEGGDRGALRCESLLLDAEGLAAESGDSAAVAHVLLMRSIATLVLGRLRESVELARAGETLCRRDCRGADWEAVAFQQNLLLTLALMGDLAGVGVEMKRTLREAQDRGNRFALDVLPVGMQNIVWLGADAPEEAEERVRGAVGKPFEAASAYYVYLGELARGYIDLYVGRPEAGLERMQRLWEVLRKAYLIRMVSLRSNIRDLRATCAIQVAAAAPERRTRLLERAQKDAKAMRREHVSWLEPRADRIEGVVAAARGDREVALALLDRAARGFERVDMGLAAAAARWRAAQLRGGAASGQQAEAEAWMLAHGVRCPERMLRLF